MENIIKMGGRNLYDIKDDFIKYLDVNDITLKNYSDGIRQFLNYLSKNGISNPNRDDFRDFRDSMKDYLSTNSINTYLTANRMFFKYLEAKNIYPDITKDVKSIKTSFIPKKQTLSKEQCKEIYSSLTDAREKLIFGLAITTGLRASEIALAKIENIKIYNNEVVLFVKCKKREDESEYVKLSEQVLNDINNYIEHRTNGYIFISTSNHNNGQGVTTRTIRRIVKSILSRYGFDEDGFSCHSLRRSMATISFNNGFDIVSIQQVLHHKSIATTRRYIQQAARDNNHLECNISNTILC